MKKKYSVVIFYNHGNKQKILCDGKDLDDACDLLHDFILKKGIDDCFVEIKETK